MLKLTTGRSCADGGKLRVVGEDRREWWRGGTEAISNVLQALEGVVVESTIRPELTE